MVWSRVQISMNLLGRVRTNADVIYTRRSSFFLFFRLCEEESDLKQEFLFSNNWQVSEFRSLDVGASLTMELEYGMSLPRTWAQ